MGLWLLLGFASLARIVMIVYGEWHDKSFDLKYTDIDYSVFSDAAISVANGGSPYDRETYRYTPVLAYMLLPNVFLHRCFGKLLFCLADVVLGYMTYRILEMRHVKPSVALTCTAVWLLNPLPIVVSSRGNAESVLGCMIVATVYLLMKKQHVAAALVYALAVHFKTYPIIYAPSIYLLVNELHGNNVSAKTKSKFWHVLSLLWPSDIAMVFAVIGTFITVGLGALFYDLYGQIFLDETYLYHIQRKDTQHNFSIYFYPLLLAERLHPVASTIIGLMAFIPQLGATLAFAYKYYRDLPFCWFITTFAFVTFNKVSTSQYFLWYLCLLPLTSPSMRCSLSEAVVMFAVWLSAQGIWFTPAYFYEYHHYDILMYVWMASLYFFWVNIWCMWKFLKSYSYSPLFNFNAEVLPLGKISDKVKSK